MLEYQEERLIGRAAVAARSLIRFAAHHELHQTVVLSLQPDNPNLVKEFELLIDRLRYRAPELVWAAVGEYDSECNQHIHMLFSEHIDESIVRRSWDKKQSMLDKRFSGSKYLATTADIKQYSLYLAKQFGLPKDFRLFTKRYRSSNSGLPPQLVYYGLTLAEIEIMREQIEHAVEGRTSTWQGRSFNCVGGFHWESNTDQTRQLHNTLKLYKPI